MGDLGCRRKGHILCSISVAKGLLGQISVSNGLIVAEAP